jgi:hypothetical protein
MTVSAAVRPDRDRIKAITSLPEAAGQLPTALAMALAGASVDDARIALAFTAEPAGPPHLAAGETR